MKIHILEPGDATHYRFILERLDATSAREAGYGNDEVVYFAFAVGRDNPFIGTTFRAKSVPSCDYFTAEMLAEITRYTTPSQRHTYMCDVAWLALRALLQDEQEFDLNPASNAKYLLEEKFRPNWRDQLTPAIEALAAQKEHAARV